MRRRFFLGEYEVTISLELLLATINRTLNSMMILLSLDVKQIFFEIL